MVVFLFLLLGLFLIAFNHLVLPAIMPTEFNDWYWSGLSPVQGERYLNPNNWIEVIMFLFLVGVAIEVFFSGSITQSIRRDGFEPGATGKAQRNYVKYIFVSSIFFLIVFCLMLVAR